MVVSFQSMLLIICSSLTIARTVARIDSNKFGNSATEIDCTDGSYRVVVAPFGSCPGFRPCDIGHYCINGEKFPCPAGSYGAINGLNNSTCTGLCSPGFFCPPHSVSATADYCGSAAVYCPVGSPLPIQAREGYYTVDVDGLDSAASVTFRSAEQICPPGHYCTQGLKYPCPGGTYGTEYGMTNLECSGVCPEGWYCPPASTNPYKFSCSSTSSGTLNGGTEQKQSKFCPAGSDRPHITAEGYYTIIKELDPHAVTIEGSQLEQGGGYGGEVICPRGSFCLDGRRHLCPAGRYGATQRSINASCTGPCTAGYYCPEGSITPYEVKCPNAASFCPRGSPAPIPVRPGYYTTSHESASNYSEAVATGDNAFAEMARTSEKICEPGFYCLSDGIKRMCPKGRYGSTYGLTTPSCTSHCPGGYYCPEGTSLSEPTPAIACGGVDKFCPPGSYEVQPVHEGYYTVDNRTQWHWLAPHEDTRHIRTAERRCEPGFYCEGGVKYLCDPGYWGGTYGLYQSNCSGLCEAGYYCPQGSLSPTEILCGEPNQYCPPGAYLPTTVSEGFYSIGDGDSNGTVMSGGYNARTGQLIAPRGHYAFLGVLYVCPAGYYGATEGLSTPTCTGACGVRGFYCPAGSTSPYMRYCGGDDAFCPQYTVAPIQVHAGFYTADYFYESCPPGMWRNLTLLQRSNAPDVHTKIITQQPVAPCQLCPNGTYKAIPGDEFQLCLPCDLAQSTSSDHRRICDCMTVHSEGHTSWFNISTGMCEEKVTNQMSLIDDQAWQFNTSRHFYNIGSSNYPGTGRDYSYSLTRFEQFPCESGHYCQKGRRYKCPPGRYGALTQETRALCEGVCTQGYFCLESSTSPMSYPCGSAEYICPEASFNPILVPPGYYSNEDVPEALRYTMHACPVGYYCPGDGRRYPCSPGTFTDQEGTVDATCMGPCDRGHYCLEASPNRRQFECGNSTVYCPRGSFEPTLVLDGFYGIFTGDDAGEQEYWLNSKNATFSAELPCEPGYYCKHGVKNACPPGTFGWRYGMTNDRCGGLCAPGYYCPSYLDPQPDAAPYTLWPGRPHLTATEYECGDVQYYCPRGAAYPRLVGGGNYSVGGSIRSESSAASLSSTGGSTIASGAGTGGNPLSVSQVNRTRSGQTPCEPGTYCQGAIRILCPPGTYGNTYGLSDPLCSGLCPASHYCPGGSPDPIPCAPNQYSTGRVRQCSICPGGRETALPCQHEKGCCFRD